MQAAGADILDAGIDFGGEVGHGIYGIVSKVEGYRLCFQQRLVLLYETHFGLGQNAHKIFNL